jgi:large subunit ribosomal protein L23
MSVLKKPIITEKATDAGEKLGQYAFIVDKKANKVEIKNAIEKMYSVTVESVNTMTMPGKINTRQTKSSISYGIKGNNKKAVVTLKKGETIDFYSSI